VLPPSSSSEQGFGRAVTELIEGKRNFTVLPPSSSSEQGFHRAAAELIE